MLIIIAAEVSRINFRTNNATLHGEMIYQVTTATGTSLIRVLGIV